MGRAPATRQRILAAAAPLFNRQGYAATAISDVMAATHMEKGGLYYHFASKAEIGVAAFEHAVARVGESMDRAAAAATDPRERLARLVEEFRRHVTDPVVGGGSPVFNAAVEADDSTDADLRTAVAAAFERLLRFVQRTVERGVRSGTFAPDTDARGLAAFFVASLEGAAVLARLAGDVAVFDAAAAHVTARLDALVVAKGAGES